jgi:L-threonate 2-dehydrogenase
VNNLLAGINLVGAAEALVLAQRMGLDPGTMLEVIGQSSGQSWIGTDRMQRALAGDYTPRAHMSLLAKDTALAIQAANQLSGGQHYPGPLGEHASGVFAQALLGGLGQEDDCALFKLLQNHEMGKKSST